MEQFSYFNNPPKKETPENKFLKFPGHQEDVYEASINLANYLQQEKISNVMFLDNSARQAYIGLKEAWKKVAEDEPTPNIYFINPETIKFETDFSNLETEFWSKYKNLKTDEPILLYDACIHSGSTLFSTKAFFDHLGFKDVKLGVTSPDREFPEDIKSKIDLVCLDHRAHAGCRPFGHPDYIEESGELTSSATHDQKSRDRAKIEHQRIKDVFTE